MSMAKRNPVRTIKLPQTGASLEWQIMGERQTAVSVLRSTMVLDSVPQCPHQLHDDEKQIRLPAHCHLLRAGSCRVCGSRAGTGSCGKEDP